MQYLDSELQEVFPLPSLGGNKQELFRSNGSDRKSTLQV